MDVIKGHDNRLRTIGRCILISLCCIVLRLAYLQIYKSTEYQALSERNFLRKEKTPPTRGNILDINGNLLATNRPVINLFWQGTGNNKLNSKQTKTLSTLSKILKKPIDVGKDRLGISCAERLSRKYQVANDITHEELGKIAEQLAKT